MNHYPRYPKHKDSGVDWIGNVPEHWEIARIKRVASLRTERCTNVPKGWQYVGLEDVEPGTGRFHPTDSDSRQMEDSTVGVFRPGDVLYGKLRPYLKKTIVGDSDGVCSTEFLVLQPKSVMAQWLHQWLLTTEVTQQIEAGCEGTKMPRADWEHVGSIPVPYPSLSEQGETIAALDRETSRIDALIAKKTRFIELLQEKRSALITHAVTKGLDPEVKMKDSGVEWIEEVPEHWTITKLKHVSRTLIGLTYAPEDVVDDGTGITVLRSSNIQDGQLDLADIVQVRAVADPELMVRVGDILICSRNGSRALIGKNIQLDERSLGCTFGAFMTVVRGSFNDFLYYVFNSTMFDANSALYMTSTVNQLTISMIANMEVPLPPEEEQRAIVSHLRKGLSSLDVLLFKTQRSIDLLKERRSALITAAVTGKIDVRGWVPNALPQTHDLKGANT